LAAPPAGLFAALESAGAISMQCPTCGFENMPGSAGCARCSSSLQIATMTMDVTPPRAASWSGRLRRLLALGRHPVYAGRRIADANAAANAAGAERMAEAGSPGPILWRMPIPGWPQLFMGQVWQAWFFFFLFLIPLLAGLFCWGTARGNFFLGAAFVIHQAALLDVLHQLRPDDAFSARIVRSIKGMFLLVLAVYLPAAVVLLLFAQPIIIQFPIGPFDSGDVLLVNHLWPARQGQVVQFTVAYTRIDGIPDLHNREGRAFVFDGDYIDRLIAFAGDHVEWDHGQLLIDGRPSALIPMNPSSLPDHLWLTVPPGDVLIFPTLVPGMTARLGADNWITVSCVPAERVRGTIYARWSPWSRTGWVQ
jgi:hypothetical protein